MPHMLVPKRRCLYYSEVSSDVTKGWLLAWNQQKQITYCIFYILTPNFNKHNQMLLMKQNQKQVANQARITRILNRDPDTLGKSKSSLLFQFSLRSFKVKVKVFAQEKFSEK